MSVILLAIGTEGFFQRSQSCREPAPDARLVAGVTIGRGDRTRFVMLETSPVTQATRSPLLYPLSYGRTGADLQFRALVGPLDGQ